MFSSSSAPVVALSSFGFAKGNGGTGREGGDQKKYLLLVGRRALFCMRLSLSLLSSSSNVFAAGDKAGKFRFLSKMIFLLRFLLTRLACLFSSSSSVSLQLVVVVRFFLSNLELAPDERG